MSTPGVTRRGLLAAASGGAAAATAGCVSRLRSRITFDPAEQVSLSIKSVPADGDPASVRVAQALREHLEEAGVDVSLELLGERQLFRDVLLNHEFDLFVAEVPGHVEPDELRGSLHSRFASEEGWQNPLGFASRHVDDTLAAQRRRDGGDRTELVAELQRDVVESQPFVPLVSRRHVTAVSPTLRIQGDAGFASSLSYLRLERADGEFDELSVALRRPNPTQNQNVLGVEYRTNDRITDLLYDPLARRVDGASVPWLAEEWSTDEAGETLTVRLREGLTWHDGEPLTASDVAFTYRFLRDTSLGTLETVVPAPRFRHRTSLVRGAEVVDDRTVVLRTAPSRPALYPAILDVPVLPEAQWRDRSTAEHEYLTRAIVGDVEDPVGSGPLRFEAVTPDQSVTLVRFEDHFLRTADDLPEALAPFAGGPNYERLVATTTPNVGTAVESVGDGTADLVDGPLTVEGVQDARNSADVSLAEASTPSYYCVGCNARRHPLSNYAFRSALASLLDREHLVETVFDGLATPVESPLHATEWVPEDLRWDGTSVGAPFAGEDGELDVEAARERFRSAGFRYHDGQLRARQ